MYSILAARGSTVRCCCTGCVVESEAARCVVNCINGASLGSLVVVDEEKLRVNVPRWGISALSRKKPVPVVAGDSFPDQVGE